MLIKPSSLIDNISGKNGSSVFYSIAGRQMGRELVQPVNPETTPQFYARQRFSLASAAYSQLTTTEAATWAAAAAPLTFYDVFNRPYKPNGKDLYMQVNTYRQIDAQTITDTPPSVAALAVPTSVAMNKDGGDLNIVVGNTAAGGFVFVRVSLPLPGLSRLARETDLRIPTTTVASSLVVVGGTSTVISFDQVAESIYPWVGGQRVGIAAVRLNTGYVPGPVLFNRSLTITTI